MLTQGFPRLVTVSRDTLVVVDDAKRCPTACRRRVLLNEDAAFLPDLESIEAQVGDGAGAGGLSATPAARFASVDALRGLTVAAMLLVNNPGDWGHVYAPLRHAQWHGCTPTDLVFPFFLFIVGVSIALGAGAAAGARRRAGTVAPRHPCWRALHGSSALGLLLHLVALWAFDLAAFRPGRAAAHRRVFRGRRAACAGARARTQWLASRRVAARLLGRCCQRAAAIAPLTNLASRIDQALLGRARLPCSIPPAVAAMIRKDCQHVRRDRDHAAGPACRRLAASRRHRALGHRRRVLVAGPWAVVAGVRSTRTCGLRRTCCGAAAGRCWRWLFPLPGRSTRAVGRRWAASSASMRSPLMPARR